MSASTYYPPQTYGNYSQQYPAYAGQPSQYPAQYPSPAAGQTQTPTFPYAPSPVKTSGSPQPESHNAPDLAEVNEAVASRTMQRFVSSELRHAGFDAAAPTALRRLELETVSFIEEIFRRAHDYANHANRANPIATDVMCACKEFYGMETKHLHKVEMMAKKRRLESLEPEPPVLLPPPSRSPSPELLESDDESTGPVVPATLRMLPYSLPPLPPKHTYLRTPATPPRKAALPSLEKKLKNASLVQQSLKSLLLATEENTDNEDGEILGAVVNWEPTTYPRKRWKLSSS